MPVNRDNDEAGTAANPVVAGASSTPRRGPSASEVSDERKAAGRRRAPVALAAAVTTIWAALVSLVPTVAVIGFFYAVDSTGGSATRVMRLGLATWLLAHGVPITTDLGPLRLAPLAMTVFIAWRVVRAGVHTARAIGARRCRSIKPTVAAGVAVGVVYAAIGALTAFAAHLPGMAVSVPRATLTLAIFGTLTGGVGACLESRRLIRAVLALPPVVRDAVRTGAVASFLVLGAGSAVAGVAIAFAGHDASQILRDYGTGAIGQAGLTVVCLLYSPTIAIWAMTYLIGPGFVFGVGTTVTAAKVTSGPMPAAPVLAGLPLDSTPGWGSVLLGLPLMAGMTAGWLLVRRTTTEVVDRKRDPPTWLGLLVGTVFSGVVAAVLLGLVSFAASGSLGSGRLSLIGPRVLPVALIGGIIIAVGALLAATATRLIAIRRMR